MKRIVMFLCGTSTALVLLFSYHTSTASTGSTSSASSTSAKAGIVSTPAVTFTAAAAASAVGAATTLVVNGTAVQTRYGVVQVQVTLTSGKLTKATAIAYPTGGRDGEINSVAIPQLESESVVAGSAQIDTVSGATFTSEGYIQSLQAALDASNAR